ncbi:hypothetical protein EST38_g6165 [Candolleomyces aberdarensis]|uniref:Uncharacterized protein n=1 Tax=Candolleomyces aberdarensis TaxID=2316362 RepID=A0A4Q2DKF5_9AGAR|nr:hypothetical protein EST38_g6165 [Candolleomyces aberdarensis]
MASSYQHITPIDPSKETLKPESKATSTAADSKADDGNGEPVVNKLAIVQLDGDDKADASVEEEGDPTYSDDEDLPDFEGQDLEALQGGRAALNLPPGPLDPYKRNNENEKT